MAPKSKIVTEANLYEIYLSHTQILQDIYARFKSEIYPIFEYLLIHSSDDAFGFYAQHFFGILIHMNSSAKVFINGVLYHPENEDYHDSFIDPLRVGSYDASYGGKTANQNKPLSRLSFEYLKNGLKRSNNRHNIASNREKLMQEIVMDTRRNIYNYFYEISKARCKVTSNTKFKFDTADTNDFQDQFAIYFKKHGVFFTEEMVRAMLGKEGMNRIFANITDKFIEKAPQYEDLHDVHLADRLVAIAEQDLEDQKYFKQVQATKESLQQLANEKKMEKDFSRAVREGEEEEEMDNETFHLPSVSKQKKASAKRKNISDFDEENDHPLLNSITQRNCGSFSAAAASTVSASVVPTLSHAAAAAATTAASPDGCADASLVREALLPPTLRELQQDKAERDKKRQAEIQAAYDSYSKGRSTTGIAAEAEVAANATEAGYSDDEEAEYSDAEEAVVTDKSAGNADDLVAFIVDDEEKPKRKRSPLNEEQKLARRIQYSKKPRKTTESQEQPTATFREIGIDHNAIGAIRQIRQRDVDVSNAHAAQDQSKDQILSLLHGKFAKDVSKHVLSTLFNEMSFERKIVEYVTACNLLVELQQGHYLFVEWDKFMKIVSDLIFAELNSTFDQVLKEWNAEVLQRSKSMPPPVLCLEDEVKANKASMDAFKRVAKNKVTNISTSTKSKLIREFCRITGAADVCAEQRKRTVRSDFERRLHNSRSLLSTEEHANNNEMELCAIFRAVHNINPAGNTQAMRILIEAEQRSIEDAQRDKLAKKSIKSLALLSPIHSTVSTSPPTQAQFKTSQSDLIMGIRLQELLMYLLGKTVVFNDFACLQVDGVSTVQFCNEFQRINLLRFLVLLAVNGSGDDDDVGEYLLNIKLHSALKGCFYVKYNDIDYHNTGGRGWCYYNATMQLWLRSESNYELTTAAMKQYIENLETNNQEFVNERIAFARHLGRVKKNVNHYFQDDVRKDSSLTALYFDSVRTAVKQFVKNQYSEGLDHAYWGNLEFVVSHDFNITGFNGVEFEQHLLPVLSDGRRWAKLKHSSLCKATESGVKIGVGHHYALNEIQHIVCSQPANYLVWSDSHFFVIESPSYQQSNSCFRSLITDAVQSWLSALRMFDELQGLMEIIKRVSEKNGDINDVDVDLVSRALHFIRSIQPNESKTKESVRMHENADGNIVEVPSVVGEGVSEVEQDVDSELSDHVAHTAEQDVGKDIKLSDHVVACVVETVVDSNIKLPDHVAFSVEHEIDNDIQLPDVASAVAVLKQKNYKIVEQQEEIARITQVLKEYEAMVKKLTEEKKALEEEVKSLTPNKVNFDRDTNESMGVDNELDRHINSHHDHSFVIGTDECMMNE